VHLLQLGDRSIEMLKRLRLLLVISSLHEQLGKSEVRQGEFRSEADFAG
jgi:hypothetical protein